MNRSDVSSLFAYNEWANDRALTSIERLTDDQFTKRLGGSFPTIRETMAHIVAAEWIWLRRWKGESPRSAPEWRNAPTAVALRSRLREVEAERAAFLSPLGDEDLKRPIAYTTLNGEPGSQPLADLLRHLVNHSTYHRGQVATMLRQVGATPLATDLLVFNNTKSA